VSLADSWEEWADAWIAWTQPSDPDVFWSVTWPTLRELLPPPGPGPVIDLGCGEGRAGRELLKLGYRVVGVERAPTLARAAVAASAAMPVLLTDAAALPFADASTGLVVACMSLLDIDDFDRAVSEIGRVLRPGGTLCLAVVHPFGSAQDVDCMRTPQFRFSRPYLEPRRYTDPIERDGLMMTFSSMHRPLSAYTSALFANGMVLTGLAERGDHELPWLLAARAEKARSAASG
jgi:SAM-dependent methyltransferase